MRVRASAKKNKIVKTRHFFAKESLDYFQTEIILLLKFLIE